MTKHIVMIEDETHIAENYRDALTNSGFKVTIYNDKYTALAGLTGPLPDLVLIDIGLGDDSDAGFSICSELRSRSKILPIVFLTARDADYDEISAFRLGADDYLTKDIRINLVIVRVKALLGRIEAIQTADFSEEDKVRGNLTINENTLQAKWKDVPIMLTVTEFWIVKSLADRPGHVKSKDMLKEAAKLVCEDNTIVSHIKRIRTKFLNLDPAFDRIDTVPSSGYRWISES